MDAATGTERATLTGHTDTVSGCAVSPDGSWIVSASYDETLRVWDAASVRRSRRLLRRWRFRPRAILTGHTGGVSGCAVSPDGSWIVSASYDETLRVWDAASGREQARLPLPRGAEAVAWFPSTLAVACGGGEGDVHLARIVGIDLGPLVVTATTSDGAQTVRCSACFGTFPISDDLLGTNTTCPQPGCDTDLRVNLFVLHSPS